MDNNCMASSKKMQNGRGRGPCYFDHLKCKGVSFDQRKSDVLGMAYFVKREGSMPILCRGRRGEFTGEKKLILKFSTNVRVTN